MAHARHSLFLFVSGGDGSEKNPQHVISSEARNLSIATHKKNKISPRDRNG
jgi:hypothetical protein